MVAFLTELVSYEINAIEGLLPLSEVCVQGKSDKQIFELLHSVVKMGCGLYQASPLLPEPLRPPQEMPSNIQVSPCLQQSSFPLTEGRKSGRPGGSEGLDNWSHLDFSVVVPSSCYK